MGKFEEVYAINVNDKVEKKGNQTYLSWAFAWAEFKKIYPDATYQIEHFDGAFCSGNEKMGYMVSTSVTADGLTYEMWLPVMDMRNKSILQPTTFDINKAVMRCLTKNLAMFGLGLYIYAGEDLPEVEQGEEQPEKNVKTIQNKPSNAPKTDDKAKAFKPITRTELIGVYGLENPEKTIAWLEGKVGKEIANFDEEETAAARAILDKKKAEREAEEKRKAGLNKVASDDIPFPLGD
jgi:hypothetical protein